MIKVVSFDIWNTLMDINKFYSIISAKLSSFVKRDYEEIYREMTITYRDALKKRLSGDFRRIIIDSANFFAERLGISTETLFRALVSALLDEDIRGLVYDDVIDTLENIKRRGLKIACLGNVMFWPGMVTRYIMHLNGILDYFDATIFSDEVGYMKPSKEIFEYLSRRLDVDLSEVIHVGDSLEHDLVGSALSGVASVLVKRDLDTNMIRLSRSAYVIKSLSYLERVIDELSKSP
ncbi:MAG: HAD family hydrolase [Sulfolobales archaeon]